MYVPEPGPDTSGDANYNPRHPPHLSEVVAEAFTDGHDAMILGAPSGPPDPVQTPLPPPSDSEAPSNFSQSGIVHLPPIDDRSESPFSSGAPSSGRRFSPLASRSHSTHGSAGPLQRRILTGSSNGPSRPPSNPASSSLERSDSRISGSDSRMSGSDSRMSGSDSRISGSDSRISGSDSKLSGSDSRVSGSGTDSRVSGTTDSRITGSSRGTGAHMTFRFQHVENEDGHHLILGREGQMTRCEDEVCPVALRMNCSQSYPDIADPHPWCCPRFRSSHSCRGGFGDRQPGRAPSVRGTLSLCISY